MQKRHPPRARVGTFASQEFHAFLRSSCGSSAENCGDCRFCLVRWPTTIAEYCRDLRRRQIWAKAAQNNVKIPAREIPPCPSPRKPSGGVCDLRQGGQRHHNSHAGMLIVTASRNVSFLLAPENGSDYIYIYIYIYIIYIYIYIALISSCKPDIAKVPCPQVKSPRVG